MYAVEKLRHNRFKVVDIPRTSELYKRFGMTTPKGGYSGDDFIDPSKSKTDIANDVMKEVNSPDAAAEE